MWHQPENDQFAQEIYLAGEFVSRGSYKNVASGRLLILREDSRLPGSLDGRVACYLRLSHSWGDFAESRSVRAAA